MKNLFPAACLALAAGALVGAGPVHTASSTHTISVRDNSFSRSTVRIARGDNVRWKWRGTSNVHNVTYGSAFRSRTASGSYSYSHRFTRAGTYTIYCSIHPGVMRMKVKVKSGG